MNKGQGVKVSRRYGTVGFNILRDIVSLWLYDRRFNKSKAFNAQGFTLIELLVVIIIIGLLAAIALPSFLNQANKARFAEAKSYVGTMSRLQQAYYLEKQIFTGDINKLGLGVGISSSNFRYDIIKGDINGATSPERLDMIVTNAAIPVSSAIKAFVGVVGITGDIRITTSFCIANSANITISPGAIDTINQTLVCPTNFSLEQ